MIRLLLRHQLVRHISLVFRDMWVYHGTCPEALLHHSLVASWIELNRRSPSSVSLAESHTNPTNLITAGSQLSRSARDNLWFRIAL